MSEIVTFPGPANRPVPGAAQSSAYLSADDIQRLTGWSHTTVYRRIRRYVDQTVTEPSPGGPGGVKTLLPVSCLPGKYIDLWRAAQEPETAPVRSRAEELLDALPEYKRVFAQDAAVLVLEWIALRASMRESQACALMETYCRDRKHPSGRPLTPPTLRRWVSVYLRHGIVGLAPGWGEKSGVRKAVSTEDGEFALALYTDPERPWIS
jgi:hypothetical protein